MEIAVSLLIWSVVPFSAILACSCVLRGMEVRHPPRSMLAFVAIAALLVGIEGEEWVRTTARDPSLLLLRSLEGASLLAGTLLCIPLMLELPLAWYSTGINHHRLSSVVKTIRLPFVFFFLLLSSTLLLELFLWIAHGE